MCVLLLLTLFLASACGSSRSSAGSVPAERATPTHTPAPTAERLDTSGGVSVCGRITEFTPATATTDGEVVIGTQRVVLLADDLYSQMGQNRSMLRIGEATCLRGSGPDGALAQYTAIAIPEPFCGTVRELVPSDRDVPGRLVIEDIGTASLAILPDVDLGDVAQHARICVLLRVDGPGEAIVVGRHLTTADLTVQRVHHCGLVTAWTAPEPRPRTSPIHLTDGSITVGTKRFAIAAGTAYPLVNVPPQVGVAACLSGDLDVEGRLISYAAQPWMPDRLCEPVAELVPPTRTRDGHLRFEVSNMLGPYTPDSYRFRIPAGMELSTDPLVETGCYLIGLGEVGDAVITGVPVFTAIERCGPIERVFLGDMMAGGLIVVGGTHFTLGGLSSSVDLPAVEQLTVGTDVCVRGVGEPRDDHFSLRRGEIVIPDPTER